jgi:predicted O-methyltransferase YrrM
MVFTRFQRQRERMKTNDRIQRRSFLQSTGALGLGMVFGQLTQLSAAAGKVNKAALDKLMAELEAKGPKFLSVPCKDGEFLNLLVKATRAKNVLEIGTSHGYSAIWISLGLEETGGHMTTVEIQPDRVALAKEHLARAGLSHRVTFKRRRRACRGANARRAV